jgi:hypothetical protein
MGANNSRVLIPVLLPVVSAAVPALYSRMMPTPRGALAEILRFRGEALADPEVSLVSVRSGGNCSAVQRQRESVKQRGSEGFSRC